MPGPRPIITEEPYPPYAAHLKREAIRKANVAGNYQPGENPPLSNSKPLSLAEQMKQ